MEIIIQENMSKLNQNKDGLKHGQFKVFFKTFDKGTLEYVINPPTQEELADGMRIIVPRRYKYSTIHHFSIYLYQLPPYLWKALRICQTNNTEHYIPIDDGIYQYSVKISNNDDNIQKLYNLIMKHYPDKSQVTNLYNHLEKQGVKGWLMISARKIIST